MTVKRWCGRAAAGTESAAMNRMTEWHGDPDEDTPYVLASDYDALERENAALREALESANGICRSAYQIAHRIATDHGPVVLETGFEAFKWRCKESLAIQHHVMFPEQYTEERRIRAHETGTEPPSQSKSHKQGCPALGGYGTADSTCICDGLMEGKENG